MITVTIDVETSTTSEMADALREIARLIESGYTTGFSPDFVVNGEEEIETEQP